MAFGLVKPSLSSCIQGKFESVNTLLPRVVTCNPWNFIYMSTSTLTKNSKSKKCIGNFEES